MRKAKVDQQTSMPDKGVLTCSLTNGITIANGRALRM
jgi:hypothetical protein